MKNLGYLAVITASVLMVSSCATIITGTQASININGQQEEPVTIKTHKATYENVSLPFVAKVNKRHLNDKITVTSPNYVYRDFIPGRKTNGWVFGNIVIGGLIGLGIDAITGGLYDAQNKTIELNCSPKLNAPRTIEVPISPIAAPVDTIKAINDDLYK